MFPTLVYQLLKQAINPERIGALLRFRTEVKRGSSHTHIVNTSAFPIETKYHVIEEGESLCGRGDLRFRSTVQTEASCPGCVAIGQNLAAWGLISQ